LQGSNLKSEMIIVQNRLMLFNFVFIAARFLIKTEFIFPFNP
jgi:hypothetical protein